MLHAAFSTQTAQRIAPFQLMVHVSGRGRPRRGGDARGDGPPAPGGDDGDGGEAAKTRQLAVSEAECRDVMWSMTDGMLWHRLVNERGWTNERFAEWLGRMWVDLLVER